MNGTVQLLHFTLDAVYTGLTAGRNGCLYALPDHAGGKVIEIELQAGNVRELGPPLENGSNVKGGQPYSKLVAAENGCLYAPPCNASHVLEINPAADSVRTIGPNLDADEEREYSDIALAGNGYLYAIPSKTGRVVEIDPTNGHVTFIGSVLHEDSDLADEFEDCIFAPAILAQDGNLYASPCTAAEARVLKINPETKAVSFIGHRIDMGQVDAPRYSESVLASNGKIYSRPYYDILSGQVLEVDPTADTVRQIGPSMNGCDFCSGLCSGGDGHVYALGAGTVTSDWIKLLDIDPIEGQADVQLKIKRPATVSASVFLGLTKAGNDLLYCMSSPQGHIFEFDPAQHRVQELGPALGCRYQRPVCLNGWLYALPWEAGFPMVSIGYGGLAVNSGVSAALWSAVREGDLSDVVIQTAHGKSYRAHKVVLAVQSPVFRSMFRSKMREVEDGLVDLGDVSPSVFDLFMRHIYGTEAYTGPVSEKDLCELSALADRYELKELVKSCAALLSAKLSVQNAASFLKLSERLQLSELKQSCFDFIVAHPDVLQTDEWEQVSPTLLREAMEAFGGIRRKRRRPSEWEFSAESDWSALTLPRLRRACAERGLAQDGDRASLVERLQA